MAANEARTLIVKDDGITNANLLSLVGGGETTLHSHAGGGGGEVYTDRGDVAAADWTHATLTADGAWHDLDLSAIVPAGATRVRFYGVIGDDVVFRWLSFRKNGFVNTFNRFVVATQVAGVNMYYQGEVECDTNRVIEYQLTNTVFTLINVNIIGWWSPA